MLSSTTPIAGTERSEGSPTVPLLLNTSPSQRFVLSLNRMNSDEVCNSADIDPAPMLTASLRSTGR